VIRINLLPSGRKKAVVLPPSLIYGAAVLVLVIIGLVVTTVYLNKQMSAMNHEISTKQKKLNSLKARLKEVENYERDNEEFRKKTRIIEQLKKNQTAPLRLLDEVSEMLPKGVWLTSLADKGGLISIEGVAFTNSDLVTYVQNLKGSKYLQDVTLQESRQTDIDSYSVYKFKLTLRMRA
jgi:type IV pilus assembly protein PilN